MTRVSENSNHASLQYALSRAKAKLENLQLKGSSLKRIVKPSDDPIGNVDILTMRSRLEDNGQFKRNINYATAFLEFTENAIGDLTEILSKAKEIAIAQSSDTYDQSIRENVAKEVDQLRAQALAIANKRLGSKYIFGGYKTHQRPFDDSGDYSGDNGHSMVEITKDFFVPINLTGSEVFYNSASIPTVDSDPLKGFEDIRPENIDPNSEEEINQKPPEVDRTPATSKAQAESDAISKSQNSVFHTLDVLRGALYSDSSDAIQATLNSLDNGISRLISLRTKVGSALSSVVNAQATLDNDNLTTQSHKSKIEDADIADLFSELTKQQNILKATYQSGSNLIERKLIDFLR